MKGRVLVLFVLLVLSFVQVFVQVGVVYASGTVYILPDGAVEGTDKILRNGDVYTFTGNVSGKIWVQKSYITIDGAGFTLQGDGEVDLRGIDLSNNRGSDPSRESICNVTVQNLRIVNFGRGIEIVNTSNNTIVGNLISGCDIGLNIVGGGNNVVIRYNSIVNNTSCITINYSTGTQIITENNIDGFIQVWLSQMPSVDRNYWSDYNGTDSDGDGIGDTPYGYDSVIDYHPLMMPVPVIPEFPSWIILPLLFVATLLILLTKKWLTTASRKL